MLNKQIKAWCCKVESLGEVSQLRVELAGNFSKDQTVGGDPLGGAPLPGHFLKLSWQHWPSLWCKEGDE